MLLKIIEMCLQIYALDMIDICYDRSRITDYNVGMMEGSED
jgi:hypothetical protein